MIRTREEFNQYDLYNKYARNLKKPDYLHLFQRYFYFFYKSIGCRTKAKKKSELNVRRRCLTS